jgi:hypothetical protein
MSQFACAQRSTKARTRRRRRAQRLHRGPTNKTDGRKAGTPEVFTASHAEWMRKVDPEPDISAELEKSGDYPRTAAMAYTSADLTTLLAEKLPC